MEWSLIITCTLGALGLLIGLVTLVSFVREKMRRKRILRETGLDAMFVIGPDEPPTPKEKT